MVFHICTFNLGKITKNSISWFKCIYFILLYFGTYVVTAVQSLSRVWRLWLHGLEHARLPVLHHLLELAQTHVRWVVMPSNHLVLCHPRLLLPSIFPSIRVFSNESTLHNRWPKYWSFSFSISHSNEYSGLISFRIDWFYLLGVQGSWTPRVQELKSLLQYHSSKASILRCSTFFIVQFSHSYMTTGKTKHLTIRTIQTFVGKLMSLLFNMLSRFITAFLPKDKHLLISWL